MAQTEWHPIAQEAIDYLTLYAPVIMLGLESAKRQLGRPIERKEFVNAKSVYAILKASFEHDPDERSRSLLEAFLRDPTSHRAQLVQLVADRASSAPNDLGHKLVAIMNRLRNQQQTTP